LTVPVPLLFIVAVVELDTVPVTPLFAVPVTLLLIVAVAELDTVPVTPLFAVPVTLLFIVAVPALDIVPVAWLTVVWLRAGLLVPTTIRSAAPARTSREYSCWRMFFGMINFPLCKEIE
jgi:hypothetical protein